MEARLAPVPAERRAWVDERNGKDRRADKAGIARLEKRPRPSSASAVKANSDILNVVDNFQIANMRQCVSCLKECVVSQGSGSSFCDNCYERAVLRKNRRPR